MAYEKQTWECGESITAEKLNHMEQGIEDASNSGGGTDDLFLIRFTDISALTVDKTAEEILEAFNDGKKIVLVYPIAGGPTGGSNIYMPLILANQARNGSEVTPTGSVQDRIEFGCMDARSQGSVYFHHVSIYLTNMNVTKTRYELNSTSN